jgi:predicted AlkP superfamily phosphohydrolase/phosphomutase
MHAGMAGFLYVNLKGRNPCGIVEPAEYEGLRDELKARFLAEEAVDPEGRRIKVFRDVHKPEEIYGCAREGQPWMPDLMLMPHLPLAVVRKIRGNEPVRWLPYRKIEGTHRPEGIVIATGPGVKRGAAIEMQMADCAPTVLAAMGCPVPADMDGRVCEGMFESPPKVRLAKATGADASSPAHPAGDEEVYSEAELAKITERLSDLGYLE